jgi:hypothetical protein
MVLRKCEKYEPRYASITSMSITMLKVLAFWWEIDTDNSVQPASRIYHQYFTVDFD